MNINDLKTIVTNTKKKYPIIAASVQETLELCLMEIDEGESISHEIELALGDIKEQIEEIGGKCDW